MTSPSSTCGRTRRAGFLPPFSGGLEFAIAVGEDCRDATSQFVRRRDVADRTVEPGDRGDTDRGDTVRKLLTDCDLCEK